MSGHKEGTGVLIHLSAALVGAIEMASPAELREAARILDDEGNDPTTKTINRPMYRALSDMIKLSLK